MAFSLKIGDLIVPHYEYSESNGAPTACIMRVVKDADGDNKSRRNDFLAQVVAEPEAGGGGFWITPSDCYLIDDGLNLALALEEVQRETLTNEPVSALVHNTAMVVHCLLALTPEEQDKLKITP